jgi:hypothetical protein
VITSQIAPRQSQKSPYFRLAVFDQHGVPGKKMTSGATLVGLRLKMRKARREERTRPSSHHSKWSLRPDHAASDGIAREPGGPDIQFSRIRLRWVSAVLTRTCSSAAISVLLFTSRDLLSYPIHFAQGNKCPRPFI